MMSPEDAVDMAEIVEGGLQIGAVLAPDDRKPLAGPNDLYRPTAPIPARPKHSRGEIGRKGRTVPMETPSISAM